LAGIVICLSEAYHQLCKTFYPFFVWQGTAMLTWHYFWLQAVVRETSPQVYEQTLQDTQKYMRTTAWDQFSQAWNENPELK
jgi:hypothetical protein